MTSCLAGSARPMKGLCFFGKTRHCPSKRSDTQKQSNGSTNAFVSVIHPTWNILNNGLPWPTRTKAKHCSILSSKLSAIILTSNCGLNDILDAPNKSLHASRGSVFLKILCNSMWPLPRGRVNSSVIAPLIQRVRHVVRRRLRGFILSARLVRGDGAWWGGALTNR